MIDITFTNRLLHLGVVLNGTSIADKDSEILAVLLTGSTLEISEEKTLG